MDWYPRYPSRFDLGTLGFSLAERGAYSCLVDTYYANEGPLPDDDAQLAAILRVGLDEWRVIAPKVRAKFTAKDGKLHHTICDELLADQARRAEISRANGRAGGRPKKKKNRRETQQDTQAATGQDAASPPQTDRQTDRQEGARAPFNGFGKGSGEYRVPPDPEQAWKVKVKGYAAAIRQGRHLGLVSDGDIRRLVKEKHVTQAEAENAGYRLWS